MRNRERLAVLPLGRVERRRRNTGNVRRLGPRHQHERVDVARRRVGNRRMAAAVYACRCVKSGIRHGTPYGIVASRSNEIFAREASSGLGAKIVSTSPSTNDTLFENDTAPLAEAANTT